MAKKKTAKKVAAPKTTGKTRRKQTPKDQRVALLSKMIGADPFSKEYAETMRQLDALPKPPPSKAHVAQKLLDVLLEEPAGIGMDLFQVSGLDAEERRLLTDEEVARLDKSSRDVEAAVYTHFDLVKSVGRALKARLKV
jgi:hypothetical protein